MGMKKSKDSIRHYPSDNPKCAHPNCKRYILIGTIENGKPYCWEHGQTYQCQRMVVE